MLEFSGTFICVIFLDKLFVQVHVTGTEEDCLDSQILVLGLWDREWSGSCLTHFHGVVSTKANCADACST